MHIFIVARNVLVFLLVSACVQAGSNDNGKFNRLMQQRLENGKDANQLLTSNGEKLLGTAAIKKLYQLNGYQPFWNDVSASELLNVIEYIDLDGLDKYDYLLPGLEYHGNCSSLDNLDPYARVECGLVLTESFLRIYYHLRFGKVDPVSLDPNWNFAKRLQLENPYPLLIQLITGDSLRSGLNKQKPVDPYYFEFQSALAQYRKIAEEGGWQQISPGPLIEPGNIDQRILQIRQRLITTNDLAGEHQEIHPDSFYDDNLQQAVIHFQRRHGLKMDGIIGSKTISAMNVPVQDRIDQVRVNLERLRWIMHTIDNDYLLIDIPGFRAYLVINGKQLWQGRIQVGKKYTQTPVFKGEIGYLEFNPTWTIPPGIIRRKILPKLRKNPAYLVDMGYLLLDRKGNEIDSLSIDWENLQEFPYIIRQPAGKNNTLGQVKFIFPNPHLVYLHDTNNVHLFERRARTFSAGCIRVENPFQLAELLLKENPGWDKDKINRTIDSGKTKRVYPVQKIPILITYTTLGIGLKGEVIFKPDIYKRDPAVLEGLNGPVKVAIDIRENNQQHSGTL